MRRLIRGGAAWLGWAAVAAGVGGGLARLLPRATAPAPAELPEEDLPPARHEGTEVGFRPLLVAGVLMLLALTGVLGLSVKLYPGSRTDKAMVPPRDMDFPAPRLQTDTGADMARFRAEQLQQLNGAYWLDRERGRVHMPVADAMRDVAVRGIPDWPSAPAWVRR